jgi:hypothetical protein
MFTVFVSVINHTALHVVVIVFILLVISIGVNRRKSLRLLHFCGFC